MGRWALEQHHAADEGRRGEGADVAGTRLGRVCDDGSATYLLVFGPSPHHTTLLTHTCTPASFRDNGFIESLNPVMDNNKCLVLANQEQIKFHADNRIIIETLHFDWYY